MKLNMSTNQIEDVSVVALKGRILLGKEGSALRERLKSLKSLIGDGKKIVLNMANVTYIDSTGLGILVSAHVSAQKQGTAVHLCDLGKKFHDLLQLTRLLTVFSVYATEADAIGSFGVLAQAAVA